MIRFCFTLLRINITYHNRVFATIEMLRWFTFSDVISSYFWNISAVEPVVERSVGKPSHCLLKVQEYSDLPLLVKSIPLSHVKYLLWKLLLNKIDELNEILYHWRPQHSFRYPDHFTVTLRVLLLSSVFYSNDIC